MTRQFTSHSLNYIKEWKRQKYATNDEFRTKEKNNALYYRTKKRMENLVHMVWLEQVEAFYSNPITLHRYV
jgi:hypothetical protein